MNKKESIINVEKIIEEIEPLIRERVRSFIIKKLSNQAFENLTEIINEEAENFMKIIRPALWRVREKNE